MKALLLVLSLLAISCGTIQTDCYRFTTTESMTASPELSGYPTSRSIFADRCDLTKNDAEDYASNISSSYKNRVKHNGKEYVITVSTICTFEKKK